MEISIGGTEISTGGGEKSIEGMLKGSVITSVSKGFACVARRLRYGLRPTQPSFHPDANPPEAVERVRCGLSAESDEVG